MESAPKLAVVVVCHDDRDDLGRCLGRLHERPATTPHEVVVVDNASRDGSVEMVESDWPAVRVLRNPANLGFTRAVNRGIRATTGELVLLLNPDTLVPGEAIDALVAELDAERSIAAIGPRIVDADGRPELSWWWHLGPLNELRLRRLKQRYGRGDRHAAARVEELTRRRRDVDWLTGACLLLRRQAVLAAGLLDESYFLYFDDVDLCAALRAGGGRVVFTPRAEIVHLRGRTTDRMPATKTRSYRQSQLHFYRKHHPGWVPLLRLLLRLRGQLPAGG